MNLAAIALPRCVDGVLKTAAQEFVHPDGRRVTFVGRLHMAEPTCYEQMAAHVSTLGEVILHTEGIGPIPPESPLSEDEITALASGQAAHRNRYRRKAHVLALGWLHVRDPRSALAPLLEKAVTHDSDTLTMHRLVGSNDHHHTISSKVNSAMKALEDIRAISGVDSRAFREAQADYVNGYIEAALRRDGMERLGRAGIYIYFWRESIAALAALRDSFQGHVVMFWHPEHALGICETLMVNQFEAREPRAWFPAVRRMSLLT